MTPRERVGAFVHALPGWTVLAGYVVGVLVGVLSVGYVPSLAAFISAGFAVVAGVLLDFRRFTKRQEDSRP